jgi:hypothetical protein
MAHENQNIQPDLQSDFVSPDAYICSPDRTDAQDAQDAMAEVVDVWLRDAAGGDQELYELYIHKELYMDGRTAARREDRDAAGSDAGLEALNRRIQERLRQLGRET